MKLYKFIMVSLCVCLIGCGNNENAEMPVKEETHTHEYGEWEVIKEATCTENGVRQRYCACGEIQKDEIPMVDHVLVDVSAIEPTCITKGNTEGQECIYCDYTTVKEIDMLGHELDEGTVISESDCMSSGEKECVCKVCGETISVEIPVLEHVFDEGVITRNATLEETGIITYTCTLCGYSKEQTIAKLNLSDYTYNSGNYLVGTDIPSGLYILYSDTDDGYFRLTSDANGNNTLDNDIFGRYTYVNITDNIYLELSRCVAIAYMDEYVFSPFDNQYGRGTYLVGKDIDAGEYKITAVGSGYYSIQETPNGKIKSNGILDSGESKYITLSNGQYVELSSVMIENN